MFLAAMTVSLAAIAWSPPAVNTAKIMKPVIEKAVFANLSCVTDQLFLLPGGAATDIVVTQNISSEVVLFDVNCITQKLSGGTVSPDNMVAVSNDNNKEKNTQEKITTDATGAYNTREPDQLE